MLSIIDIQKLESEIYKRFLANLTERYKIVNGKIIFYKDYNKIKDKETVERMIKGGKVEIKNGGSTSLQMPGFIHDPKISEYSSLVKNFNKQTT